jgi:hypothetical protein
MMDDGEGGVTMGNAKRNMRRPAPLLYCLPQIPHGPRGVWGRDDESLLFLIGMLERVAVVLIAQLNIGEIALCLNSELNKTNT